MTALSVPLTGTLYQRIRSAISGNVISRGSHWLGYGGGNLCIIHVAHLPSSYSLLFSPFHVAFALPQFSKM